MSTGKADWAHDVTSVSGSGAHYLDATSSHSTHLPPHLQHPQEKHIPGVHSTAEAKKTTVLNGSHHTISEDQNKDTVLVLPDYKVVAEVERSSEGAKAFWKDVLEEKGTEKISHVLPYACVILLCASSLHSFLPPSSDYHVFAQVHTRRGTTAVTLPPLNSSTGSPLPSSSTTGKSTLNSQSTILSTSRQIMTTPKPHILRN